MFFRKRKGVVEQLYEKNLELVVRNKTLSFLEKLYSIGFSNLSLKLTAEKISSAIQEDFNFEFVNLLGVGQEDDSFVSLSFCASKGLEKVLKENNILLSDIKTSNILKNNFFISLSQDKTNELVDKFENVYKDIFNKENLEKINQKSKIKEVLIFCLRTRNKILGFLILGLSSNYDSMSLFEKESIKSFISPLGLILDSAYINEELQDSNKELEKLSKAKSEFISIASHQLRTPLTAVKGYVSMILEGSYGKIPRTTIKPLENVFKSNERLVTLVNDLLSISRIESGKIKLEPKMTSIEEIIDGVVFDLKINADKKDLYLKIEKPKELIGEIMLDPDKMRQAVLNLVDNAIKYTDKGGITIKVKTESEKLKLIIQDTGGGMTQEEIGKVFESFSRGTVGQRANTEGAGLGLYIVRKFIEMHEGRVWAESAGEGKGTTFFIEVPVRRS